MYLLGIDLGSSSVKVSLLDSNSGKTVSSASFPKVEMKIISNQIGWAEQNPADWWENTKMALSECLQNSTINKSEIKSIGISYQMHGLVCINKNKEVLRPSIIWCDSRAVSIGNQAFNTIGNEYCLTHYLNSPGNFTASKLKWVKENEPNVFEKIYKIMLPGDFLAMKLTGEISTTVSGLSEGILWDFKEEKLSLKLLENYGISTDLIPTIVPTFSNQGNLTENAAKELGLSTSISVCYRAGDQPNNAFSLNVLEPGEVAATAGTSGVIYGVTDKKNPDAKSRVNTFVHVNNNIQNPRNGVLLCVNGTGIQNSFLKNTLFNQTKTYNELNELAKSVAIGSEGLRIYPFGNGSERIFENKLLGSSIKGIQFNSHTQAHFARAVQEGIVFGLNLGFEIMSGLGLTSKVVRAGEANMFLSETFRTIFCNTTGSTVELYKTDGAQGAARGAGVGAGVFANFKEAFIGLEKTKTIEPDNSKMEQYKEVFEDWKNQL